MFMRGAVDGESLKNVDFSLSIKRIVEFVESSFAENYNCSLYDEDSVWGVLLAESHVPNTLSGRRACYGSYIAYLQQLVSTTERCYPFAPVRNPIQEDMAHPIPPKCGCRYIPSALQSRCRAIGGHTHCPTCRLVVPYSLFYWQHHVTDICSLPREEHLLLTLTPGALFDCSNSGTPTTSSTTNSFKVQVCLICSKMFRDEDRLKRHYMFNHWMETNIDFRVAHQIDPIRGLYAVINYGNFFVQVTYFVKQYNTANCYVCTGGLEKLRKCPHFETVLQNSYPVEEYIVPENVLSQLPLDVVNRYRKFEEAATRNAVPAMVALKSPPHAETTLFSIFDEDNLLKRFTVIVLSSQKSVCSCAASNEVNCWHRLLVKLVENDPNRTAKCGFNLTEMKTFLENCKLTLGKRSAQFAADSLLHSSEGKTPVPTQNAFKLVLGRLNHEIDLLQNEVNSLRMARIERYGEYNPTAASQQEEISKPFAQTYEENIDGSDVGQTVVTGENVDPQTVASTQPGAIVEEVVTETDYTVVTETDQLQIEEQVIQDNQQATTDDVIGTTHPLNSLSQVEIAEVVIEEQVETIIESTENVVIEELSASEESAAEEKSGPEETTDAESESQSAISNNSRSPRRSKRTLGPQNGGTSPSPKRITRAK